MTKKAIWKIEKRMKMKMIERKAKENENNEEEGLTRIDQNVGIGEEIGKMQIYK